MKAFNTRRWSTPLIIGSSVVVAISGVLLFFHLSEGLLKSMHEWLGLLFVAAIALHVLNHWNPFSRYFQQKTARWIIGLVLVTAMGWIGLSSFETGQEHPAKRLVARVQNAPLTVVAELSQQSSAQIIAALQQAGFKISGPEQSINQIAQANNANPFRVIDILLPPQ